MSLDSSACLEEEGEEEEGGEGVRVWVWREGVRGGGAEITVNVTLPPLSIIHFQSIAIPGFVRQLGDDASKMGSIA